MILQRTVRAAMAAVLSLLMVGAVGCGASPKKFDVEVTADPELKSFTVPVDIVGVNNESEKGRLSRYEVDKWFSAGDALRAGARRYEMIFKPGGPDKQTLSAGDAVWDKWDKPTEIVIFAQVPQYAGARGDGDARKLVLPTMSDTWTDDKLQIIVRRSGLEVRTAQKKK